MEISEFNRNEKRVRKGNWTDEETEVLLKIWQDYYNEFRNSKRHKRLYKQMSLQMSFYGFSRSYLEVQYKMKNMASIYNVQKRLPQTKWKYFKTVQQILNSIKNTNQSPKTSFSHVSHHPIVKSETKDFTICSSLDKLNSSEINGNSTLRSVHLVKISNNEKIESTTDSGECSDDSGLQACIKHSTIQDNNPRSPSPQCKAQNMFPDDGTSPYQDYLRINSIISNNLLDPEFNFLMSLLPYLKNMPMQQRLKAHIRIQEVLQEMGDFQD